MLRKLNRSQEVEDLLCGTRRLDLLDAFSRFLSTGSAPQDGQQKLDLVFDLLRAGLLEDALGVAESRCAARPDGAATMLQYVRAEILSRLGRSAESGSVQQCAANADPAYVFPARLEEMIILQNAIRRNFNDGRAPFYLGNLLYDRRRHQEAIELWERSVALDPGFPTAWRNLAFAYFNFQRDQDRALAAFARARKTDPQDARILFEYDQLRKRTAIRSESRLAELAENRELVGRRDDLSIELATLYNNVGHPESALDVLTSRQFQPWEGGEGLVHGQYIRANVLLGHKALRSGKPNNALACFTSGMHPPENLREAQHLLANLAILDYWMGVACEALGSVDDAQQCWVRAAAKHGDIL